MRVRCVALGLTCAALCLVPSVGRGAPTVTVIATADEAGRFPGAVATADAKVGTGAVVYDLPAGKTSFLALSLADLPIDLGQQAGLAFWWKVEGPGLRSLTVKTRFPTMLEGRQRVFPVWSSDRGTAPGTWTPALVSFAAGTELQGEPSQARSLEFRVQTDRDAAVRFFVDHVVALSGALRLQVGSARREGAGWVAPVAVTGDGDSELTVDYGVGSVVAGTLTLAAGQTLERLLPVPVAAAALQTLKPLDTLGLDFWAEIRGVDLSRAQRRLLIVQPLPLPPHPRLLLDAAQVAEIKARCARHDGARQRWETERNKADAILAKAVELPPRGGTSAHYFANPKTGGSLKTGKQLGPWQWEYTDSTTGEVFRGDPAAHETDYDGVKIGYIHAGWASDALTLGLVHQLSGEPQYAHKAREILLAYAEAYLSYPLTRYGNPQTHGKGRATADYLTESTWLIDLAQATDLVWDQLDEPQRRRLADRVFYPALRDSIRPVRCYVHNIQCWKNSAVGLVGLLYDDPELIHNALHDPAEGYWQQIGQGVLPGGVWYEGSWGYHFYTLSAIVPLTEACRHAGIDLYVDALKAMHLAPTRFVMPDLRLPNFNDAGLTDLTKLGYRYELAAARWPDEPAFQAMLGYTDRNSREALLCGVATAAAKPALAVASANHSGAGYAILSRGAGPEATWLCLKYGPDSGYHDHPDRLGFILYARGRIVAPDPGSLAYGLALQRDWYKTTLSHSTLAANENSQQNASGKCLGFGTADGVDYALLDAGEAIPGLRFVRTAALVDENLVVFIDQVRGDQERLLDFAYHQDGTWAELPPGQPWAPPAGKAPYTCLSATTSRSADLGLTASTRLTEQWQVAVTVAGGAPTEAIAGTGPGIGGAQSQVPCLILRRRAAETALAWAVALDGQAPRLEWLDVDGVPRSAEARLRVTPVGRPPFTLTVAADRAERPFSIER